MADCAVGVTVDVEVEEVAVTALTSGEWMEGALVCFAMASTGPGRVEGTMVIPSIPSNSIESIERIMASSALAWPDRGGAGLSSLTELLAGTAGTERTVEAKVEGGNRGNRAYAGGVEVKVEE